MPPVHDDRAVVRSLVTAESAQHDDQPAVAGWLQRMCRAAVKDLPAAGVGVSLLNDTGGVLTAAASDPTSFVVEELQFTLGEGPCLTAYESRSPVLVPDLSAMAATTWPAYAVEAHEHGVKAVFAFPLQVGITRLGALDVYRSRTGGLSPPALIRALSFAEIALEGLLGVGDAEEGVDDFLDDIAASGYRVYQAQGMVMVQLGVSAHEALVRLRAYAYAHDRRLSEVADDVLRRRIALEPDNSEGWDEDGEDRS